MEAPDHLLHKEEGDEIEQEIGRGYRQHELRDLEAAVSLRDQEIPIAFERRTVGQIQDEYDERQCYKAKAGRPRCPGEGSALALRHEYLDPFQQNRAFDQRDVPYV